MSPDTPDRDHAGVSKVDAHSKRRAGANVGRPRKDEAAGDIVERLREAALAHFGRKGFGATSLSDIAAEVGVTRTTLLYHFESKERLYAAVVEAAFSQIAGELVGSMLGGGPLQQRVRAMVRDYIAYVDTRPHLAKLMIREVIDERGPGCELIRGQGLGILRLVERFVAEEGGLKPRQTALLREILLQINASVMVRSASGSLRATFWGDDAGTGELANLLLDSLIGGAER